MQLGERVLDEGHALLKVQVLGQNVLPATHHLVQLLAGAQYALALSVLAQDVHAHLLHRAFPRQHIHARHLVARVQTAEL